MDAKKCDRCGDFYIVREESGIEKATRALREFATPTKPKSLRLIKSMTDLCPECTKSLEKWFSMKEKGG